MQSSRSTDFSHGSSGPIQDRINNARRSGAIPPPEWPESQPLGGGDSHRNLASCAQHEPAFYEQRELPSSDPYTYTTAP